MTRNQEADGLSKVFVYGTLKEGDYNNRVLHSGGTNPKFIGERIVPGYVLVSLGGFPTMVPTPKGVTCKGVVGELYEIEEHDRLDQLEGYPSFNNKTIYSTEDETFFFYECLMDENDTRLKDIILDINQLSIWSK